MFQRGWVTLSANFSWKGASPKNHCWFSKLECCSFVRYQNICSVLFGFVTKHACDRQTEMDRIMTANTALAVKSTGWAKKNRTVFRSL